MDFYVNIESKIVNEIKEATFYSVATDITRVVRDHSSEISC